MAEDSSIVGSGQTVDPVKLEARLTRLDVSLEQANYTLKDLSKVLRSMDESNRLRNGRIEKMESAIATHHLDHADDDLLKRVGNLELRHEISDSIQRVGWKMVVGAVSFIAAVSSAAGALVAFFLR